MKNLSQLTIVELELTKTLIDQLTQVLFQKNSNIPMTQELKQIQNSLNDVYSDYADAIDKENEQLQKYRDFVIMIASEQLELSQEKAQLQQRDWRSKAVTLTSQLEFDLNFDTEDTSPLDNDF